MKISKEAHVFYSMVALAKVVKHFGLFLIDSKAVAHGLKQDIKAINTKIERVENRCNKVLGGTDKSEWQKQWTERDYNIYADIFFLLNDMTEEQREVALQMLQERCKGNVTVEIQKDAA